MKCTDIRKRNDGQLLIELLLSLLIGGILLISAGVAIAALLRYNFEARISQVSALYASDLMNVLQPLAEGNWRTLYDLSRGDDEHYYVAASSSEYIIVAGEDTIMSDDFSFGILAAWKFDESTSTIVYDHSGNGNNATISADMRLPASSCMSGRCLQFTSDEIVIDPSTLANQTDGGSSYWLYLENNNVAHGIYIIYNDEATDFIRSNISAGNVMDLVVEVGNVENLRVEYDLDSLGYAYTDTWLHISWVYGQEGIFLYINGEPVDATVTVNGADLPPDPLSIKFGHTSAYLDGRLDDIRFFDRALTAAQVEQLYESKYNTRWFTVHDVYRDVGGAIVADPSGATLDPSTLKISVHVETEDGKVIQHDQYLTRANTRTYLQTDWRNGYGAEGPVTSTPTTFSTSTNMTADVSLTLATTSASGSLESVTFDTQVGTGAALHSVMWQGTQPAGTAVRLQIAPSNSSSGPWNYQGSDGTAGTYFTAAPNVQTSLMHINNFRYFRYKVFLEPSEGTGPTVEDVITLWAP